MGSANKALSQEEQTVLSNIKSLVDQMQSLEAGEEEEDENMEVTEEDTPSEEEEVSKETDENEEEEGGPAMAKAEKAAKIEAQNAEDRVKVGEPEEQDEAMRAMKALAELILGTQAQKQKSPSRPARKSATQSTHTKAQKDAEIKRLERLVRKNSQALESLLEGLGVAEEVKKSAPTGGGQEVRKNSGQNPVGNSDREVVQLLQQLVNKSSEDQSKDKVGDSGAEVRKDLSGVLPSIFGQTK